MCINLAKEIKDVRKREEMLGLSDDELAFYDTLANNKSAGESVRLRNVKEYCA